MVLDPVFQQRSPQKVCECQSKVVAEGDTCDAKTIAARRKRSEIRRFKLMAACGSFAEPPAKRTKAHDRLVSELEAVAETHGAGEERRPTPRECTSDVGISINDAGAYAGAVMEGQNARKSKVISTAEAATVALVQRRTTMQEDEEGEEEELDEAERRLNGAAACPAHCVVSICGRSREMEDAAVAVPSFLTLPSEANAPADTFHFFAVYDGHGGPQAAEFCKERLHGTLAEEMSVAGSSCPSHWDASMQSCFRRLDAELCGFCPHGSECTESKAEASTSNSCSSSCTEPLVAGSVGSTAVVAVVGASHIVVANCGDSRALLCRGRQAVPLSTDHKAGRPDEVARIEAAGGHVISWQGYRVLGVLAMSRALGDRYLKPYVIGQPEVTCTARSDDDECLILASDGLWDVLSNELVCNVARKALAGWRSKRAHQQLSCSNEQQQQALKGSAADHEESSPAQVVAALLTKLALAKNSKDNISVVVVDLKRL